MSESNRLTHSAKEGTFLWPTDFVLGNVGDLQRLDPFSLVPQLGPEVRRITRSRAYGNTGIPHILRHNTGRHQSGKKLVLRRKASVPQHLSAHTAWTETPTFPRLHLQADGPNDLKRPGPALEPLVLDARSGRSV